MIITRGVAGTGTLVMAGTAMAFALARPAFADPDGKDCYPPYSSVCVRPTSNGTAEHSGGSPPGGDVSRSGGSAGQGHETRYVPPCQPNTPDDESAMCAFAGEQCDPADPLARRYWVYQRPAGRTGAGGWQFLGLRCLNFEAVNQPPPPAVIWDAIQDFLVPHVTVRPYPRTVVQLSTFFDSGIPATKNFPVRLGNAHLDIRAQAASFVWHFGDATVTGGSTATHRYATVGPMSVTCTVYYHAQYSLDGRTFQQLPTPDPAGMPINGPAVALMVDQIQSVDN
ncbi:MAG: hypothetical protein ACJ73S_30055 [Mycobacteriales bacterium]